MIPPNVTGSLSESCNEFNGLKIGHYLDMEEVISDLTSAKARKINFLYDFYVFY